MCAVLVSDVYELIGSVITAHPLELPSPLLVTSVDASSCDVTWTEVRFLLLLLFERLQR